jgi:hypothetical protein
MNKIKETLENHPLIQFGAMVSGAYDLILYLLLDTSSFVQWERLENLRATVFPDFSATWYIKSIVPVYSFIPIRDIFFKVLGEKVWKRTLENPRPRLGELLQREYRVLKSLNSNGNRTFQDIDKENNFAAGTSRHIYYNLLEEEKLNRVTISLNNVPLAYNSIITMELDNSRIFDKNRNILRFDIIRETDKPTNEYTMVSDISDPDGVLFIKPIYKDKSAEEYIEWISSSIEGARFTKVGIITKVLIGNFCYRRFDNTYTIQYGNLVKTKALQGKEKIRYAYL